MCSTEIILIMVLAFALLIQQKVIVNYRNYLIGTLGYGSQVVQQIEEGNF